MLCKICNNELEIGSNIFEYFFDDDVICKKCRNQFEVHNKYIEVGNVKIYCLYVYNDYFERVMFWFKECLDIYLKDVFIYRYIKYINNKYDGYTIVYVPSSEKKNKNRTFIALEEIFSNLTLNKVNCLYKISDIKQNIKSMNERSEISKHIVIDKTKLKNIEKVLLVDDVCTSGNSIKAAYTLLKEYINIIEVLCVAIHPLCIKEE